MITYHYYLRSTIEINKEIQDEIISNALRDIARTYPRENMLEKGMAERGVGPIDGQVDVEFFKLLENYIIKRSSYEKIIQSDGEGQDPKGMLYRWKLIILIVPL